MPPKLSLPYSDSVRLTRHIAEDGSPACRKMEQHSDQFELAAAATKGIFPAASSLQMGLEDDDEQERGFHVE